MLKRAETTDLAVDCKDRADTLATDLGSLLCWGELTAEEREQITQACNAAELALQCIRGIGPRKPVTIGF